MKLSVPLKDIMLAPGKRFDPAEHSEQDVITRIKKLYGVIAQVMDIVIDNGMAHIEFRDATPEKFADAMKKLARGVDEAGKGRLPEALKLFQEVLAVIPENVAARRNMAKVYMEQGKLEKAKQHLQECLQIDPTDAWSYVMLGNIYVNNESNLDIAAFYYEKCLEHHPKDAMVLTNYAGLMTQKREFQKAEILFKEAIKIQNVPNAFTVWLFFIGWRENLKKVRVYWRLCLSGYLTKLWQETMPRYTPKPMPYTVN